MLGRPRRAAAGTGTDGLGHITSWDISEGIFVSYPATPGNCSYSASTTTGDSSLSLTQDNDGGSCGSGTTGGSETWSGDSGVAAATPVPATLPLFATVLSAFRYGRLAQEAEGCGYRCLIRSAS
jgi:hypothetical protein